MASITTKVHSTAQFLDWLTLLPVNIVSGWQVVWHTGVWIGCRTLMTILLDGGVGVAV